MVRDQNKNFRQIGILWSNLDVISVVPRLLAVEFDYTQLRTNQTKEY